MKKRKKRRTTEATKLLPSKQPFRKKQSQQENNSHLPLSLTQFAAHFNPPPLTNPPKPTHSGVKQELRLSPPPEGTSKCAGEGNRRSKLLFTVDTRRAVDKWTPSSLSRRARLPNWEDASYWWKSSLRPGPTPLPSTSHSFRSNKGGICLLWTLLFFPSLYFYLSGCLCSAVTQHRQLHSQR